MVIDDQHSRAHTLIVPNTPAGRIVASTNRLHTISVPARIKDCRPPRFASPGGLIASLIEAFTNKRRTHAQAERSRTAHGSRRAGDAARDPGRRDVIWYERPDHISPADADGWYQRVHHQSRSHGRASSTPRYPAEDFGLPISSPDRSRFSRTSCASTRRGTFSRFRRQRSTRTGPASSCWSGGRHEAVFSFCPYPCDVDDPLPAGGPGCCECTRPARIAGLQQWGHHISAHEGIDGTTVIAASPASQTYASKDFMFRSPSRWTPR